METLFSVCWDLTQAKAETCPGGVDRVRANGGIPADADRGSRDAADFESELAARLGTTGANTRGPWASSAERDAVPVGTGVDGGPGTGAERGAREADEVDEPGEAGEAGDACRNARAKRHAPRCWSAGAGLALFQEMAEAGLAVKHGGLVFQGARAQAEETATGVDAVPAAAALPESAAVNPAAPGAGNVRAEPASGASGHGAGRAVAEEAPLPAHARPAALAPRNGTLASKEAGAGETREGPPTAGAGGISSPDGNASGVVPVTARSRGGAAEPNHAPGAENRIAGAGDAGGRESAMTPSAVGGGAKDATAAGAGAAAAAGDGSGQTVQSDEARQGGPATHRVWQDRSARGDGPAWYIPPDGHGDAGEKAALPTLADGGTRSAAPAARSETAGRLIVQENPGTAKPASAASSRESHLAAAGSGPGDAAASGTARTEEHRLSPAAGIELEMVPGDDAPVRPMRPGQREVSEVTDGLSGNLGLASKEGSTTRGAQDRADTREVSVPASADAARSASRPESPAQKAAFAVSREMRSATHGRGTDSALSASRMEGAKGGAVLRAQSAGQRHEASSSSRPQGAAMSGPHAEALEEDGSASDVTAGVLPESSSEGGAPPRSVSVMQAAARADYDGDNGDAGRGEAGACPWSHADGLGEAASGQAPEACRMMIGLEGTGQNFETHMEAEMRFTGESPHHLHAPAGERTLKAIRRWHRGVLDVDDVPARGPAVGQDVSGPEGKAPGVEEPVPGCHEAAQSPSRGETGRTAGAAAERAAEHEDAEPVSDKPSAAASSVLDSREVMAEKPPAPCGRGISEREAPVTARTVVDQIVRRAELRLGRSEAEMVIDLKPDVLGRVHLRISAEPGRIVAQIRVESAVTRQLIEAGLGDLKAALAERGLDLGNVAVSGGFGAGIAWDGARSGWLGDSAGRGTPGAAPGGGSSDAIRAVPPFLAARPFQGTIHLVDCVA
ncbi:MAG: flagellar hook-length control protein FliK [Clostridia bacterium]